LPSNRARLETLVARCIPKSRNRRNKKLFHTRALRYAVEIAGAGFYFQRLRSRKIKPRNHAREARKRVSIRSARRFVLRLIIFVIDNGLFSFPITPLLKNIEMLHSCYTKLCANRQGVFLSVILVFSFQNFRTTEIPTKDGF